MSPNVLKIIAAIAAALWVAWGQRDKITAGIKWATGNKLTAGAEALPTPAEAFAATQTLVTYFDQTGCPEGAKAARAVAPHILHESKKDPATL